MKTLHFKLANRSTSFKSIISLSLITIVMVLLMAGPASTSSSSTGTSANLHLSPTCTIDQIAEQCPTNTSTQIVDASIVVRSNDL